MSKAICKEEFFAIVYITVRIHVMFEYINLNIEFLKLRFLPKIHVFIYVMLILPYSHLSNKRGGWNKRGGGAKNIKSINVEVGIIVEAGIFL